MASTLEDPSFTLVASSTDPVAKTVLKTKLMMVTKEEIKKSRNYIRNENGEVKILQLIEKTEKKNLRTVIFRSKSNENGKILNPPLEEVMPPFQKWMAEVDRSSEQSNFYYFMKKLHMRFLPILLNLKMDLLP